MTAFSLLKKIVLAAGLAFSSCAALAGTVGDTLNLTYYDLYSDDPSATLDDAMSWDKGTKTIATAGMTFQNDGGYDFDIYDNKIVVHNFTFDGWFNFSTFNGFKLTNLTPGKQWGSLSVGAATNTDLDCSWRCSVSGNVLQINWAGVMVNPDTVIEFNVGAVPEPETYAMLLGGLAVLAAAVRRRRSC